MEPWAAAYDWQQRNKSSSLHAALRVLAFKRQRIIWRCWQAHMQRPIQIQYQPRSGEDASTPHGFGHHIAVVAAQFEQNPKN